VQSRFHNFGIAHCSRNLLIGPLCQLHQVTRDILCAGVQKSANHFVTSWPNHCVLEQLLCWVKSDNNGKHLLKVRCPGVLQTFTNIAGSRCSLQLPHSPSGLHLTDSTAPRWASTLFSTRALLPTSFRVPAESTTHIQPCMLSGLHSTTERLLQAVLQGPFLD
jgi:hypothetical protein